ncbi:MAG: hypothetical protein ACRDOB_17090, partial [Streptosporangiaceae bacterium]
LTTEAAHGQDDLARPYPQAGQLDTARDRVARLNKQLGQAAVPQHAAAPQDAVDDGEDWLVKAAMHDAGVMAGIPGSSVVVISHHDSQPESAVQASRYDFPSDNPFAGAASETGPASPRPLRPPGRSARPSP